MNTQKLTDKDLEIRRLQHERDLYRARAIDEVLDNHNTSRLIAAFDVDLEVKRHLQGVPGLKEANVVEAKLAAELKAVQS